MSLKKRHIGRRVAGVGVGVALMVLGLEAPAFAATTVTAFTPTSGPAAGGCVLDVTGTGFALSPEANTTVKFLPTGGGAGTNATVVTVISDTEIWATSPALAPTPRLGGALGYPISDRVLPKRVIGSSEIGVRV